MEVCQDCIGHERMKTRFSVLRVNVQACFVPLASQLLRRNSAFGRHFPEALNCAKRGCAHTDNGHAGFFSRHYGRHSFGWHNEKFFMDRMLFNFFLPDGEKCPSPNMKCQWRHLDSCFGKVFQNRSGEMKSRRWRRHGTLGLGKHGFVTGAIFRISKVQIIPSNIRRQWCFSNLLKPRKKIQTPRLWVASEFNFNAGHLAFGGLFDSSDDAFYQRCIGDRLVFFLPRKKNHCAWTQLSKRFCHSSPGETGYLFKQENFYPRTGW